MPNFIPAGGTINQKSQPKEPTISDINLQNEVSNGNSIVIPTIDSPTISPTSTNNNVVEQTMGYFTEHRSAKIQDVYGSPSLFNKNALFVYPTSSSKGGYKNFTDNPNGVFLMDTPTTKAIIEDSKPKTANDKSDKELFWSDFAYVKQHGFIPNNRLIILRRYPFATYSNLQFPFNERVKCLAKGITYFGEGTENSIGEILKLVGYKNYKDLTADLTIMTDQGQNKGLNSTPLTGNKSVNKNLRRFSALSGKGDVNGSERVKVEAMRNKNWENERKGKENVIHKTNIADVGVGANLEFNLVFEYELRSFNGINPRIAMLDLITNLMTLCHTNAEFWGGQNVVLPNPDNLQFPFIGDQDSFYRGDYEGYLGSVVDWFSEPFKGGGSLSGIIDGIMSGDLSSLGDLLGKVGTTVLDLSSSKSRSTVVGMKALLDSSPIGNYHLTVGNPLQPIAKIGNLICPSFELKLGEELGHNDMPTSVKLTMTVKTATPLDSTGIQTIFSNGLVSGRMYMKPEDFIDVATSTTFNGQKMTKDDIDRANGVVY